MKKLLDLPSSVLIGSRAFNLHTRDSPTDICVLDSEVPSSFVKKHTLVPAKAYMNVIPPSGAKIIRLTEKRIDTHVLVKMYIIIFKDAGHLNIVKDCIDEMRQIPRYLLANKNIRTVLFEELLIGRGFVRKKSYKVSSHDDIEDVITTMTAENVRQAAQTSRDYNRKMAELQAEKVRNAYAVPPNIRKFF